MSGDDPFENVLVHLHVMRRRGDTASALCPAHEDRQASLSISRGDDVDVVLHCHAGCTPEAVCTALGVSLGELTGREPHLVCEYEYRTAEGVLAYVVERWSPKTFRPRLIDGTYGRPRAADELLYNLPRVTWAKSNGAPVYVVEGERDVETCAEHDVVATTAMSGASQAWLPQFSEALAGADVVIVADADQPGRARARRLVDELQPYARTVRAVVPRYGKDITDHLLAGYSLDLLNPLAAETGLVRYGFGNIASQPIDWAWKGWLPAGMFTIVEGDPGDGKSTLTADLAARWSTGMPMPDGTPNPFGKPVKVGMMSSEDDPGRIIKPRLIGAGANPNNVIYIEGVPDGAQYVRHLDLELDVDALHDAIVADRLSVVLLDPLMAYLGNTRTNLDNEVRRVLGPLRIIAEETGCAIIAVRHLRKSGGKAVYAGGGSIAFTGFSRVVLVVGRNPHDAEQRVLAQTKNNLAAIQTSLAYRIVEDTTGFISAPRLIWEGESELMAVDLLDSFAPTSEVRAEVTETVVKLLQAEELSYDVIKRRVLNAGVECSEKTLRSVLKTVARRSAHGFGSEFHVTYKLRSSEGGNVEPTHGDNTEDDEALSSFGTSATSGADAKAVAKPVDGDDEPALADGKALNVGSDQSAQEKLDLAIECTKCGTTDELIYFEDPGEWRCRHHTPLTYGG